MKESVIDELYVFLKEQGFCIISIDTDINIKNGIINLHQLEIDSELVKQIMDDEKKLER